MCKLQEAKFQTQLMENLSEARVKPGASFQQSDVGPFWTLHGCGKRRKKKRANGKAYGVIFTDLAMRAVHIVCGYDTEAFLLALSRFVSIRS